MRVTGAQLVLANGETITLTADEAAQLLTALQARRTRNANTRDVVSEVGAFLEGKPRSSVTEIARGIGARDSHVRETLKNDPNFQIISPGQGRSTRLRAWIVSPAVSQAGPREGTTTSATGSGRPS